MAAPPFSRGDVVYADPGKINDRGFPITKTTKGRIGKHPIIVLRVDVERDTITGVLVTSFNKSASLARSLLPADRYRWFLPVIPATKESIHEPIPTRQNSEGIAEWVNLMDEVTIPKDTIVHSFFVAACSSNKY